MSAPDTAAAGFTPRTRAGEAFTPPAGAAYLPITLPDRSGDYITILRSLTDRPSNKLVDLSAGGKWTKTPQGAKEPTYSARAAHVPTAEALSDRLRALLPSEFIIAGWVPGTENGEAFGMAADWRLSEWLGLPKGSTPIGKFKIPGSNLWWVGRFNENFAPSTWWPFDADLADGMPAELRWGSPAEWFRKMQAAGLMAERPAAVVARSNSARVLLDGKPVLGTGVNFRAYVQTRASEGGAPSRVGALMVLAHKAGLGWMKPAHAQATGEVVSKTAASIFDPAPLRTPVQPEFDGAPALGPGALAARAAVGPANVEVLVGEPWDTTSLHAEAPDLEKFTKRTGCTAERRGDGSVRLGFIHADLLPDLLVETSAGSMTVAEFGRSSHTHLRAQVPSCFRDSDSWNAFLGKHADGSPFLFDNGAGIRHTLPRPETPPPPSDIDAPSPRACAKAPPGPARPEPPPPERACAPSTDGPAPGAEAPGCYKTGNGRIYLLKRVRLGDSETTQEIALTNFVARIVADIVEDDGAETRRVLEIGADFCGRKQTIDVAAKDFAAMQWVIEMLGPSAIVYPPASSREHARAAIQTISGTIARRTVYTHLGWIIREGEHIYLSGSGGIGGAGPVAGLEVRPPSPLARYVLPAPPSGPRLAEAVRALLRTLAIAPDRITVPLFCAVGRSIVRPSDFSLHLAGETGTFKSALAAVFQACFGRDFDGRTLPCAWCSTDNALAGLAHAAQSALIVVDDFIAGPSMIEQQKLHAKAERLMREAGNQAGRQRMRADTTLRPAKPPSGLLLSTGEDCPRGHSLRARMPIIELAPNDVNCALLTESQVAARDGLLAEATAAFVSWLAGRRPEVLRTWTTEIAQLRDRATGSGVHRRLPEIVAQLARGADLFFAFAQDRAALASAEVEGLRARVWDGLGEMARAQSAQHHAADPTRRFLELLGSALTSGRAHVASPAGGPAVPCPEAWGWRETQNGHGLEWRPSGARVGWLEGEDIYLDPSASYAAAEQVGRDNGEGLGVSPVTLRRRMADRGLLASTDTDRQHLTVRKPLEGRRRDVLHLLASRLSPPETPDPGPVGPVGPVLSSREPRAGAPAHTRACDPPMDPTGPTGPTGPADNKGVL